MPSTRIPVTSALIEKQYNETGHLVIRPREGQLQHMTNKVHIANGKFCYHWKGKNYVIMGAKRLTPKSPCSDPKKASVVTFRSTYGDTQ